MATHALIRRGDRYLAVRRSASNDYQPLKWDLPGGTVEEGETLLQALVREVKEETSLTITGGTIVHVHAELGTIHRPTVQCVYLCASPSGEVALEPDEHDMHAWLPRHELDRLHAMPYLVDMLRTSRAHPDGSETEIAFSTMPVVADRLG